MEDMTYSFWVKEGVSKGDLLQIREVQVGLRKGGVVVGLSLNGCNCMALP